MQYDLHVHTRESDGKYSNLELMKSANDKNFAYIAFCDHNVCNNINPCILSERYIAKYRSVCKTKVIPSIELDVSNEIYRRIHILGYGIIDTELLTKRISEIQMQNVEATVLQIKLINEKYGTNITKEQVEIIEGTKFISSKGLKQTLIKLGIVQNMRDTYKFVSHRSDTHVDRKKIKDVEAIDLIHKAGGIAVLAHPIEISDKKNGISVGYSEKYEEYLQELIRYGLNGVESHTVKHSDTEKRAFFKINYKYNLISTAGTDFHDEKRTPIFGVSYNHNIFLQPLLDKVKEQNKKFYEEKQANER